MGSDFVTVGQAAALLGYHRDSVAKLCRTKRLAARREFGRFGLRGFRWLIPVAEVEQYLGYRAHPLDRRRPKSSYEER